MWLIQFVLRVAFVETTRDCLYLILKSFDRCVLLLDPAGLFLIALAPVLMAPALLALAACSGDDTSIADPPISSAPTSSTPPQQRETPEHFIRRWAEEEKRMENTE